MLVRGLNALIGAVSTPLAAPVVAAARLRGGNAPSSRGAASLITQAVRTARGCGCGGTVIVRMDSAYYAAAAAAAIPEDTWTAIKYPQAIWDDQLGCWVSDAEVAETSYAAFTSKKDKDLHVTARLIVRRVRDKARTAPGQGELFPAWRYHAVFTDSPFQTLQAEEQHRGHAVIEQLLADHGDGPLAHLPSGKFTASTNGPACSKPPAGHPPQRPDQPRPGPHPKPPGQPALIPRTSTPDKPQNSQRQGKHTLKALTVQKPAT